MILVTGATGVVGRRVVEQLRRQGRSVRGLIRDPAAAGELEALGADALVGDVTRAVDRASALVGVERVIACHTAAHEAGPEGLREVDHHATVALIDEAAAAGVRHFTLLSHLGCDRPQTALRLTTKRRAEQALEGQPTMAWTILRLAPLASEIHRLPGLGDLGRERLFILFGPGRTLVSPVSPDDAATLAIRAADEPGANRTIVEVGGPEALAWRDLPVVCERAWGETVTALHLPLFLLKVLRWLLSLLAPTAGARLAYLETLYTQDFVADPGQVGELFGLGLEDVETWLRRQTGELPPAPPDMSQDHPPARAMEPDQPAPDDRPDEPEPARTTESPTAELPPEPDDTPARTLETAPAPEPEPEPAPDPDPALTFTGEPEAELPLLVEEEPEPEPEPEPPLAVERPLESADDEPDPEPAGQWGRHATFGDQTPEAADEVPRRPAVERPRHVDRPVIDLDE